jgi:hypothetical protein
MAQTEFNKRLLQLLLSIVAEMALKSDVGDNGCTRLFAEIRALANAAALDLEEDQ